MYTAVQVWPAGHTAEPLEGHAYDISEGGVRFELDTAIPPGAAVTIRVQLPRWMAWRSGTGLDDSFRGTEPTSIEVLATVLWIDDDGVPGPVRMAAAFTSFLDAADRERLLNTLATGTLRRAA